MLFSPIEILKKKLARLERLKNEAKINHLRAVDNAHLEYAYELERIAREKGKLDSESTGLPNDLPTD